MVYTKTHHWIIQYSIILSNSKKVWYHDLNSKKLTIHNICELLGTFFLFGVSNALGIIFVIKVVPETNGRTLEQIQLTIKG